MQRVCLYAFGIFCVCEDVHLCGLCMLCGMALTWYVPDVCTRCMYLACGPLWMFQERDKGDHGNQGRVRVFEEPYADQFVLP